MEVNQTVYLKPIGDNARHIEDDIMSHIEQCKISKIGRKYFYVDKGGFELKFEIEDNLEVCIYSRSWQLYFSIQEILDEKESEEISRELRKVFNFYGKLNLTLDKLKRMQEIINK